MSLAIALMALMPRCGMEPCAVRPKARTLSQSTPFSPWNTLRLVGSATTSLPPDGRAPVSTMAMAPEHPSFLTACGRQQYVARRFEAGAREGRHGSHDGGHATFHIC